MISLIKKRIDFISRPTFANLTNPAYRCIEKTTIFFHTFRKLLNENFQKSVFGIIKFNSFRLVPDSSDDILYERLAPKRVMLITFFFVAFNIKSLQLVLINVMIANKTNVNTNTGFVRKVFLYNGHNVVLFLVFRLNFLNSQIVWKYHGITFFARSTTRLKLHLQFSSECWNDVGRYF